MPSPVVAGWWCTGQGLFGSLAASLACLRFRAVQIGLTGGYLEGLPIGRRDAGLPHRLRETGLPAEVRQVGGAAARVRSWRERTERGFAGVGMPKVQWPG